MAIGKTVFGLWWQEAIVDYKTFSRKPTIKELARILKTTETEVKSRFWAEYDPETDKLRPVGLHCDELRVIVRHFDKKYPYFCVTNSSILEHESKRIRRSVAPLWSKHVHFPGVIAAPKYNIGNPRRRYSHKKPLVGSLRSVPDSPADLADRSREDVGDPAKD